MFEIKDGIMSVINVFACSPSLNSIPQNFLLDFWVIMAAKCIDPPWSKTRKKKVFIVDINCRALICSFTEHDGSAVRDRIIADGAERFFLFFGKCAVTDLCGCGWNTDDPTAFLKPPPFVPSCCFICLRLPPPLRGESSPLEDGGVAA